MMRAPSFSQTIQRLSGRALMNSATPTRNRLGRWAEVITHVPCGGHPDYPAGRVQISATLDTIDGNGGTLGFAGRTAYWNSCPTISATGAMTFDIDDISDLEFSGTFEGVILHEMGHVFGLGCVNKMFYKVLFAVSLQAAIGEISCTAVSLKAANGEICTDIVWSPGYERPRANNIFPYGSTPSLALLTRLARYIVIKAIYLIATGLV